MAHSRIELLPPKHFISQERLIEKIGLYHLGDTEAIWLFSRRYVTQRGRLLLPTRDLMYELGADWLKESARLPFDLYKPASTWERTVECFVDLVNHAFGFRYDIIGQGTILFRQTFVGKTDEEALVYLP